jgi:hypothetical protein
MGKTCMLLSFKGKFHSEFNHQKPDTPTFWIEQ